MYTDPTAQHTLLASAAIRGDTASLRRLLAAGVSPNERGPYRTTALRYALDFEQWECCHILLDAGADPNINSDDGNSSDLMFALIDADDGIIHRLLEAGADVNYQDDYGNTALLNAAEDRFYDSTLALLLEFGADPNLANCRGTTPLHRAARFHHPEHTRLLLAYGADPQLADKEGRRPLDLACSDRVRTLLSARPAKAAPERRHGRAHPLMLAALAGDWKRVEELRAEGTDAPGTDGAGRTLLHFAARDGKKNLLRRLLAQGADANARDAFGETPLHYACEGEQAVAIAPLLEAGADPDLPDVQGNTVLHVAAGKSLFEGMLSLLLTYGADPGIANKVGETPLFEAVRHGSISDMEALLAVGANPTHRNNNGQSPPDFARSDRVRALLGGGGGSK